MEDNLCPRCKTKDTKITNYSDGEVVCSQFGYVYEVEFIDEHTEQRVFSKNCSSFGCANKDLSRISAPPSTYYFGNSDETTFLGKKKINFMLEKII